MTPHDRAEPSLSAPRTCGVEAWLATALFGIALGLVMASHEMWRDELQAWLLARDSSSLADLWRNTRYEGHPLLWHLCLWALARFGAPVAAMQVLHWAVATGAAALLLHRAPFPFAARVAVVFSYLPFFEYGVISRNYAATVLSLLLFAHLLARSRLWPAAGAAAVAANASPMGMVLAPALTLGLWVQGRRRALGPAVLVLAGVAASVAQCLPPLDYEHARGWHPGWDGARFGYTVRNFAAALLPLPSNQLHFWNTSALFHTGTHPFEWTQPRDLLACLLLLSALFGVAWLAWHRRPAAIVWLGGSASLLAFAYLKFPGAVRHGGFLWILALVALWLAWSHARLGRRVAALAVVAAVAVADLGTLVAVRWELAAPFSGAACAGKGLQALGLARLPIVAGCDFAASGVSAYLGGGKILFPALGTRGSFVVWNLDRLRQDTLTDGQLLEAAAAVDKGAGVIVLHNRPLELGAAHPPRCELLLSCGPTIVADEAQLAYLCRARP